MESNVSDDTHAAEPYIVHRLRALYDVGLGRWALLDAFHPDRALNVPRHPAHQLLGQTMSEFYYNKDLDVTSAHLYSRQ